MNIEYIDETERSMVSKSDPQLPDNTASFKFTFRERRLLERGFKDVMMITSIQRIDLLNKSYTGFKSRMKKENNNFSILGKRDYWLRKI